jgi:hypothetical protein
MVNSLTLTVPDLPKPGDQNPPRSRRYVLYHQPDNRGALRIWDKLPEGFRWPAQQLSAQDAGDGYLADVVASQFQGALAAHVQFSSLHRPVVFGERGETIGQLKMREEKGSGVGI